MPDMNTIDIYSSALVFLGAFAQGVFGFGFSLCAMPLTALIMPISQVAPAFIIFRFIQNLIVLHDSRKSLKINKIKLLILFGIIGTPLGAILLSKANADYIKVLIGLIILGFSSLMLFGKSIKLKNYNTTQIIAGLTSGFMNGAAALSGPATALFLTMSETEKSEFRANISFYSIIINIFASFSFIISGLIDYTTIIRLLIWTPAFIIGSCSGLLCASKLQDTRFRKLTLILISIFSLIAIIGAIKSIVG
jgi:uncharacterized membrane protein YfcA